jgi:hypothetical protein
MVLVLRRTETVLALESTMTRSGLPSPSMSATATPCGALPVGKSILLSRLDEPEAHEKPALA